MPRDTAAIKSRHSVYSVAARFTKLEREGDEWRGLCPFHKEKSPSFTVVEAKGYAHCFGCGFHGDQIPMVMNAHQIDFAEACDVLEGSTPAPAAHKPAALKPDEPGLYDALT